MSGPSEHDVGWQLPSGFTGERSIAQNGENQYGSFIFTVAISGDATAVMRAEITTSVRTCTLEMR
jgi:hypothetical protein